MAEVAASCWLLSYESKPLSIQILVANWNVSIFNLYRPDWLQSDDDSFFPIESSVCSTYVVVVETWNVPMHPYWNEQWPLSPNKRAIAIVSISTNRYEITTIKTATLTHTFNDFITFLCHEPFIVRSAKQNSNAHNFLLGPFREMNNCVDQIKYWRRRWRRLMRSTSSTKPSSSKSEIFSTLQSSIGWTVNTVIAASNDPMLLRAYCTFYGHAVCQRSPNH